MIAALNSQHTERLAIDMTISGRGTLAAPLQDRSVAQIDTQPCNGGNAGLIAVGAGCGVIKLRSEPPHWSADGR